jgi:hypothetical protein
MKFDLDQFVSDCGDAIRQDASHKFVREVIARAVSNPRGSEGRLNRSTARTISRS